MKSTKPAQQGPETAPATDSGPVTQVDASNQEANDALSAAGPAPSGLENYQEALGTWLGSELYEAVSPHLSQEAVQGYAEDLVGSLLGSLGDMAGDLDGNATDEQLDAFMQSIESRLGPLAADLVAKHGDGLVQALQGWVNANPELVAATAVLAAAGAVLADMDVPQLKKRLSITDELTAELSTKLGSLRNLGLEQVKARLQYESGPLMAAVQAEYGDAGVGGEGTLRYGDDTNFAEAFGKYDAGSQLGTFGMRGATDLDNGLSLSGYAQGDTAGNWETGMGAEYTSERVKADIELAFGSAGARGEGSAEALWGTEGDWVTGGNFEFELRDEKLLDVGLYAGFRDRDEFRTYLGRYAYDGAGDKHSFGVLVEEKLGPIYGRLEHSTQWSATGTSTETGLHGAYFLDDDTAIIGGARHFMDEQGQDGWAPGVGLQLDRNALMLEYDTRSEAVMLNFTMPFGR